MAPHSGNAVNTHCGAARGMAQTDRIEALSARASLEPARVSALLDRYGTAAEAYAMGPGSRPGAEAPLRRIAPTCGSARTRRWIS